MITSRPPYLPPDRHWTILQTSQLSMCKVEVIISNIYLLVYFFCWFPVVLPPPSKGKFNSLDPLWLWEQSEQHIAVACLDNTSSGELSFFSKPRVLQAAMPTDTIWHVKYTSCSLYWLKVMGESTVRHLTLLMPSIQSGLPSSYITSVLYPMTSSFTSASLSFASLDLYCIFSFLIGIFLISILL